MNLRLLFTLTVLLHVLSGACVPLRAALVERWTFNDVPSTANGATITGENGLVATIRGAGAISTNAGISLPGGSPATQAYIDLPNGLISPLTDLTIEVWLTLDTLQDWQRVFDFGSTFSGEITGPGGSFSGRSFITLLPSRATNINDNVMTFWRGGGSVSTVDTAVPIALGAHHLFTYVWDQTGGTAVQRWYLDGVFAGQSGSFAGSLSQIDDVNNWLGRSNFSPNSNTDGTYDECAIYDHAMSATEIQARFAAGPAPNTPPVYEKIFDFTQVRDGWAPFARLVQGSDGNFYGTTTAGGTNDFGTVYRMTPAGKLTTLLKFPFSGSNKGFHPNAGLVQGSDGNFYGTTTWGGPGSDGSAFSGNGTVFKMTPAGVLTTLVDFTNGLNVNGVINKGKWPGVGLVQGSDGNFYGTTGQGGATGDGTVFKMTPAGMLTTLVEFSGNVPSNKGSNPSAVLVQRSDGSFYGTTQSGGADNLGTVFKMTPAGVLTTLVEFTGNGPSNRGQYPAADLVQGSDSNFYGTTVLGGAYGYGTVFKMTPAGVLTTLVDFTENGATNKGRNPQAGLVQGSDGDFYGTTEQGGSFGNDSYPGHDGYGTVFKLNPNAAPNTGLTTLVEFTGGDGSNRGSYPVKGLVQGNDGNFYGTTFKTGLFGYGTVFKINPNAAPNTGLTTLVEFKGNDGRNNGILPLGSLVQERRQDGSLGDFYGMTNQGGTSNLGAGTDNFGTVFKVTPAGALTTLVAFTGTSPVNKGIGPYAGLVQERRQDGSYGDFYGTTGQGGATNLGTVFKMTPAGMLTTLVEFTDNGVSNKGNGPTCDLVQGSDGNFYGTTTSGGVFRSNAGDYGFGTVFRMTPAGELTTLVSFPFSGSNKGFHPNAGLVQGSDGNFYGTTSWGGPGSDGSVFSGSGTVFKVTLDGVLTTLVDFTDGVNVNGVINKGKYPTLGSLVQGNDGNLYGMTGFGGITGIGGAYGYGTVFKVDPNAPPNTGLTTLVEFTGNGTSNKGSVPGARLVQGRDGNFYGATQFGGIAFIGGTAASGYGTVFKMTPAGVLTTLVEFASSADGYPIGALTQGIDGNLYGTTSGPDGTIYRLLFPGAPLVNPPTTAPGSTDALVSTKVNARGAITAVQIEHGTDAGNLSTIVPVTVNLNGYQSVLLGRTLSGLSPGTTYYYRFTATSSYGTTVSPVASFSTLARPEAVATPATAIMRNFGIPNDNEDGRATLNGTVNARNYGSTVYFEYATDENFTFKTPSPVQMVQGNSPMPVFFTVLSLPPGTTYFYRIVATNAGGTTISGAQSFTTLTNPVAVALPATAVTSDGATLHGTVNALGATTTVVFEYGTDAAFTNPLLFTSAPVPPLTVTGNSPVPVSVTFSVLPPHQATYFYRVKATSAGGVGVSAAATLTLDVLSQFTQTFPGGVASTDRQGFVIINLIPSGLIVPGWRFVGEQVWRASGVPLGGLETGDRAVEYRPVPGFIQPPPETVNVISGGLPTVLTREYYETGAGGLGGLTVTLTPPALADPGVAQPARAQWRFLGQGDPANPNDATSATWRNSGTTVTGLVPGDYLVECKPVTGWSTPPPLNVPVVDGQTSAPTMTYLTPPVPPPGLLPGVLSFETVSGSANLPYAFVGQLRSSVGVATGFAVRVDLARTGGARVVATAGHVVFDDGALSYAAGLQWLFQRDRGTYEPEPLIPKGAYVFDGYASRRIAEATPGRSSAQSQHLDVAAIYFDREAARGGFSGYLASDATDNEFLLSSALKTLVGYPVDGIVAENQGRMHATPPANVQFARVPGTTTVLAPPAPASPYPAGSPFRLYATSDIRSSGGNSGGPLCVQFGGGNYYPAGIFLGGAGQSVVRAIDSQVIDLFRRAEVHGYDGSNNTGGGIVQVNTPLAGGAFSAASIKVNIAPAGAVNGGARWKLGTNATLQQSGTQLSSLSPANYNLVFTGASGFITPETTSRTLSGGALSTINATYNGFTTHPASRTVFAFEDATFSVAVSGTPTSYQWHFRPTVGATVIISGATSSSYTRVNVDNSARGEYAVAVTWPNGVILSSFATLTVNPTAQAITFPQPPNRILDDGSFVLDASASSDLPVAFQLLSGPATLNGDSLTPTGLGTVTVRASQPGNANYSAAANKIRSFDVLGDNLNAWRTRRFTAAELGNPLISGPLADFDGDGANTLLEFSLNLDPKLGDRVTMTAVTGTRGLPLIRSENISGQQKLTAEFVRRRAAGSPGITYNVELNSVLTNPTGWTTGGTEVVTPIDATWERVKVTDPQPALTTRYGRLKVTMP